MLNDLTVKEGVGFGTLFSEELSVVECMTKIVRQIVSVSRSRHQHIAEYHCRVVLQGLNEISFWKTKMNDLCFLKFFYLNVFGGIFHCVFPSLLCDDKSVCDNDDNELHLFFEYLHSSSIATELSMFKHSQTFK